jgi:hypothetical protein
MEDFRTRQYGVQPLIMAILKETGHDNQLQMLSMAIDRLQALRIFSIPSIAQFYFDRSRDYPKLKEYVRQLDYIRLLLLEYLQSDPTTRSDRIWRLKSEKLIMILRASIFIQRSRSGFLTHFN